MAITNKKPPVKQTVGAQYICFNTMSTEGEWTETFDTAVQGDFCHADRVRRSADREDERRHCDGWRHRIRWPQRKTFLRLWHPDQKEGDDSNHALVSEVQADGKFR